jgi:PhnB protein
MRLNSMLTFSGQCEAAFKFYEECLGGKIVTMLSHGNSPMAEQVPAEWRAKILHATFAAGDTLLMGYDAPPDQFEGLKGFSVVLGIDNLADAHRIFEALAAGGTVQLPLQQTFWSAGYGLLTDQFGIPWMINCEQAGDQGDATEV